MPHSTMQVLTPPSSSLSKPRSPPPSPPIAPPPPAPPSLVYQVALELYLAISDISISAISISDIYGKTVLVGHLPNQDCVVRLTPCLDEEGKAFNSEALAALYKEGVYLVENRKAKLPFIL